MVKYPAKLKERSDIVITDVNNNKVLKIDCLAIIKDRQIKSYKSGVEYIPILDRKVKIEDSSIKFCVLRDEKFKGSKKRQHYLMSSALTWCDGTNQYESKNSVIEGIVGLSSKGNQIRGTFLYNPLETVIAFDTFYNYQNNTPSSNQYKYILNSQLAQSLGYIASYSSPFYFKEKNLSKDEKSYIQNPRSYRLSLNVTYLADDKNPLTRLANKVFSKTEFNSSSFQTKVLENVFKNLTFGIEYETIGVVNPSHLAKLGLVPLKDGSIGDGNFEYTTVVMNADKNGFLAVKEQCEELTKSTQVDINCALHIHVGSFAKTREMHMLLYSLAQRVEENIFKAMPYYKQREDLAGKRKNYSRKMPNWSLDLSFMKDKSLDKEAYENLLSEQYNKLYSFMSGGKTLGKSYNLKNAKMGVARLPWSRQWNCPTRYFWINFINAMFSKSGTIEFRVHPPTTNFDRVGPWLLFCLAFVRFAEVYPEKIVDSTYKITLDTIIDEISTGFGQYKTENKFKKYLEEVSVYIKDYFNVMTARNEELEILAYSENVNSSQDNTGNFKVKNNIKDISRDKRFKVSGKSLLTEVYQ